MQEQRSRPPKLLIVVALLGLLAAGFFVRQPEMAHIQLAAEPLFTIAGFTVTNTIVHAWLTLVILGVFFRLATRKVSEVPTGLQNLGEFVLEFLLDFCKSVAGEKNGRRFFPIVASIFGPFR